MGKLNISLITQYTTTCNLLPHFGGVFLPWSTCHWPKTTLNEVASFAIFQRCHPLDVELLFSKCVIKGMLSSTPPSPWKWTSWTQKITQLQRKIIFEASILGFRVNLPECNVFLRICQIGSFPEVGVKIKHGSNHHLVLFIWYVFTCFS